MKGLFEELRRRNVLRATALYGGAAWLLVQIATQVFPFFDIPNQAVRAVVVLSALGLPVVVLLSWFYAPKPAPAPADEAAPAAHLQRRSRWLGAAAVLCGIVFAMTVGYLGSHRASGTDAPAPVQAVAVLPFKNLSSEADNAYFAEGVQDEILTRLSKLAKLKVISRTSTARYAAAPADPRDIAQQLGVTHLVEGAVQRNGSRARISVRLIDAKANADLWAESYDRELNDIFDVESDVAKAVATALQTRLSFAEQAALQKPPTRDAQAYDAYLRGLAYRARSFDPGNLAQAAEAMSKATTIDPRFTLAWTQLARIEAKRQFLGLAASEHPCERARRAAATADRLDDKLGETALALGDVRLLCDADVANAERAYTLATERLPNSAEARAALARIAWQRNDWSALLQHLDAARQLDPRNIELLSSQALYLGLARHFDEARAAASLVLDIDANTPSIVALLAQIEQAQGRLDEAQRWLDRLPLDADTPDVFTAQMLQLILQGRDEAAAAALRAAVQKPAAQAGISTTDYFLLLATVETRLGHTDAARQAYSAGYLNALQYEDEAASAAGAYRRAMLCIMAVGKDAAQLRGQDCTALEALSRSTQAFAPQALEALSIAQTLGGDPAQALTGLTELLKKPYYSGRYTMPVTPALLRLDPVWAPLRGLPAFEQLTAAAAR